MRLKLLLTLRYEFGLMHFYVKIFYQNLAITSAKDRRRETRREAITFIPRLLASLGMSSEFFITDKEAFI